MITFWFFPIGLLLIVLTFIDFFYTTLSGNGSGFLTKFFNNLLSKLILSLNWKGLRKISGFLHVVGTLNLWLISLILGCFFIFSSEEAMIVNATTNSPANFLDRFYYTCYILSTVGIGDYKPSTNFAQVVTGLLSFSGFILLTTALAYVISVTGAVSDKRNLAVAISSRGKNPRQLYAYFIQEDKYELLFSTLPAIQSLLHKFTHNYLSFPMIENYLTNRKASSEALQIVNLYEVLRIIFCQAEKNEKIKLLPFFRALAYFMEIHMKNEKKNTNFTEKEIQEMRKSYWIPTFNNQNVNKVDVTAIELENIQLKNIDSLLASSGWNWKDVYNFDDEKSSLYE